VLRIHRSGSIPKCHGSATLVACICKRYEGIIPDALHLDGGGRGEGFAGQETSTRQGYPLIILHKLRNFLFTQQKFIKMTCANN